jgi:NAD+ kinase
MCVMEEERPRQLGLVVHPTREVQDVLDAIAAWAAAHGVEVGQVRVPGQTRRVADAVDAAAADLLLAIGGDGTTLAALHAGAEAARPVLGVACGSVGALTSVAGDQVTSALDQVTEGHWTAVDVPALELVCDGAPAEVAINDIVVIRDGPGQVIVSVSVDEVLWARVAGDGVVVATELGSSAYTMAAGGPLLAGVDGIALTPLAAHGGSFPALVVGRDSRLSLSVDPGYGGVRHELDGRRVTAGAELLEICVRAGYATLVRLAGEEPRLTGLRRRGLVLDSPRALVRHKRPLNALPSPPSP